LRRALDYLLVRPLVDWPIAIVAAVALWNFGHHRKEGLVFGHLQAGTRASLYVTLAGIAGALLGFFIATISILLGFLDSQRPRLKRALGGNRGALIQPVFFSAISITALTIPASVALLILDRDEYATGWMEATLIIISVVASIRTARLIWLIRQVVTIATKDAAEAPETA
jgi:hypothetical protein